MDIGMEILVDEIASLKDEIYCLKKDAKIMRDHPLVMLQSGTSNGDRVVRVINKLQAENERLKRDIL